MSGGEAPGSSRPRPGLRRLAIVVLVAIGTAVAGCDAGPSELTVHNRTTEAITFTELGKTNGVAACASARFTWPGGRWEPEDPSDPVHDLTLAGTPVWISSVPGPDGIARMAVIVTADGARTYPVREVPELPPCEGNPPAIPPEPTIIPAETP